MSKKLSLFLVAMILVITMMPMSAFANENNETPNEAPKETPNETPNETKNKTGITFLDEIGVDDNGKLVEPEKQGLEDIMDRYKDLIAWGSAFGTASAVLFFIINFIKLGAAGTDAGARKSAISGLIWSGVATAGLGAVSIIAGFAYGAFANLG